MNRRGFVGAALAGLGGLFLPHKSKADDLGSFKFGDYVDLELPIEWDLSHDPRKVSKTATYQGYITYVDEDCLQMQIQTMGSDFSLYRVESTWYWNGRDACKISRRGER